MQWWETADVVPADRRLLHVTLMPPRLVAMRHVLLHRPS